MEAFLFLLFLLLAGSPILFKRFSGAFPGRRMRTLRPSTDTELETIFEPEKGAQFERIKQCRLAAAPHEQNNID